MATVDVGAPTPGAPHLPARPSRVRSRATWLVATLVVLGLCIYGWINVGGSLNEFLGGFFGHHGIIDSFIGPSLPPQSSAFGQGFRYAATTFFVAILSVVIGFVWSIAMLPWAARNLARIASVTNSPAASRRSCARSRS